MQTLVLSSPSKITHEAQQTQAGRCSRQENDTSLPEVGSRGTEKEGNRQRVGLESNSWGSLRIHRPTKQDQESQPLTSAVAFSSCFNFTLVSSHARVVGHTPTHGPPPQQHHPAWTDDGGSGVGSLLAWPFQDVKSIPSPVQGDGASSESPFLPARCCDRAGLTPSLFPYWRLKTDSPFHNLPL